MTYLPRLDNGSNANINLLPLDSATFNGSTGAWSFYKDAAQATPEDGTLGSPTLTGSYSTTTPIFGNGSFLITKAASNLIGEGAGLSFSVPLGRRGKPLVVEFEYLVNSGTYATGDMTVYLYDVTNSTLIQPAGYQIAANAGSLTNKHVATFQTSATGTTYRLLLHVSSTSTSAYSLKFDNFRVGPQVTQYGAPITDWQAYTPTFTGFGTVVPASIAFYYRRVGDSVEIYGKWQNGTTTAVEARISIPTGLTTGGSDKVGSLMQVGTFNTSNVSGDNTYVFIEPSVTYMTFGRSNAGLGKATASGVFNNSETNVLTAMIPVAGWSSNVQMSSDTDTRVVACRATRTTNYTGITSQVLVWNSASIDTHAAMNTSTGLYTCPVPGFYRVNARVLFGALDGATDAWIQVQKNGSGVDQAYGSRLASNGASGAIAVVNEILSCNAGDTIGLLATGDASFDVDFNSGTRSFITIERLSGPSAIAASEKIFVNYRDNGGTALTANTTNITWSTKIRDTHGAWGGSTFTAPRADVYSFSGMIRTGTSSLSINAYVDSSLLFQVTHDLSGIFKYFSGSVYLTAGQTLSFRSDTGATLSSGATQNWITISSQSGI